MKRIRITRNYKEYIEGQTLFVSPNEAFGLIDKGVATLAKDMTASDYQVNKVKQKKKSWPTSSPTL